MMGRLKSEQAQLFYQFQLDDRWGSFLANQDTTLVVCVMLTASGAFAPPGFPM
ncbi:MAG: hypothetical protein ACJ8E2_15985 [Bradyrhizobium sp.]